MVGYTLNPKPIILAGRVSVKFIWDCRSSREPGSEDRRPHTAAYTTWS